MPKKWTPEQWKKWHELVDWSHKISHEGAKKLLEHIGMPQETCSSLLVFNVQDDIAYAVRRGAARMLNELNEMNDNGEIW